VTDRARLSARAISKRFPAVLALDKVDFDVDAGEAVAVIGENGAGKSTLMKILAGIDRPDEGTLELDGKTIELRGVRDALSRGIALIHQELCLAENLDVGANLFLGREPRRFGWIDRSQIIEKSKTLLEKVGLDVDPETPCEELSIGQRQLVEIARALAQSARFLILDEPTSSLTLAETERLLDLIEDLRRNGTGIVYISHRLSEVSQVADRVVVLRDGCHAGELKKTELSHEAMVARMVGREVSIPERRAQASIGSTVLQVSDLRLTPSSAPLDFNLREGQIVGLAGLVGSGRTELLELLFGVRSRTSGQVQVGGKTLVPGSPREAVHVGMGLVPEERGVQGLVLDSSTGENLALPSWREWSRSGIPQQKRARSVIADLISRFDIRPPDQKHNTRHLSGGNQQKVALGKWIPLQPRVLLLDEPTRGVDVAARWEIHRRLRDLAQDGMSILFSSSELEEILILSDQVWVLHEGKIAGTLAGDELSEEEIMRLATGGKEAAA